MIVKNAIPRIKPRKGAMIAELSENGSWDLDSDTPSGFRCSELIIDYNNISASGLRITDTIGRWVKSSSFQQRTLSFSLF